MAVYIIDKGNADIAVSYARMDESPKILLIQDGLYLSPDMFSDLKVFVFSEEVQERGLDDILPQSFERIDYSEGIDIMIDEKIFSFC